MKITKTERGFRVAQFVDRYGAQCSIQKSSLATADAIWIGIDNPEINVMADGGWQKLELPEGSLINSRMHLTQEQVAEILPVLEYFVQHGELPK